MFNALCSLLERTCTALEHLQRSETTFQGSILIVDLPTGLQKVAPEHERHLQDDVGKPQAHVNKFGIHVTDQGQHTCNVHYMHVLRMTSTDRSTSTEHCTYRCSDVRIVTYAIDT